MADKRELAQRATQLAHEHPPIVVLENLFLNIFALIGWVLGRLWFHGSRFVYITGLALADGYSKGAKIPPRPPAKPLPPGTHNGAGAPQVDLLADDRIVDHYQTPFGVPFGPNVHGSHD